MLFETGDTVVGQFNKPNYELLEDLNDIDYDKKYFGGLPEKLCRVPREESEGEREGQPARDRES